MHVRYEIRAAGPADFEQLLALAEHLNTVNLPHDPAVIRAILDLSHRSFSGEIADPTRREYIFVLRDLEEDRAVGTSLVLGQLGNRDAPYLYFDVRDEERYSATLDRHFSHQVLNIRYSYHGPTQVGGLVMHPDYRRRPEKLGQLVSYARFLWMAMRRPDFQDQVVAELLPPLEPDGTSHLWQAVGRRFTDLSYGEADRLSKQNKEFVRGLFPDGDIYATLLSDQAQGVIGKVGAQTKGVEKMLRRIGFRYAHRVDPFDGGPHFAAAADEIPLIRRAARHQITIGDCSAGLPALLGVELAQEPWFRLVRCAVVRGKRKASALACIPHEVAEHLGVGEKDPVWVTPLPSR